MDTLVYPTSYQRVSTREVRIGPLLIGADHPVLPQSMLVAPASDLEAALAELKALAEVGCPLVRLTIPSKKELDAMPALKERMRQEGIDLPLVADIHFTPSLAVEACEHFEKVRINPGNFTDSPKAGRGLSEAELFEEGRLRLAEALKPLAEALKKYDRALRVGVNQGSLSQRMIERYGDSPMGMVESALECCGLLEELGVTNMVISLKSSNPMVVQKAYRLLVERQKGGNLYPVHLGVTEAGEGLMARVKSLAGIATLLADGIGDTIRVSLTEDSVKEIPFAKELIRAVEPLRQERTEGSGQEKAGPALTRELNHLRMPNGKFMVGHLPMGSNALFRLGMESPDPELEPDFLFRRTPEGIEVMGQNWPIMTLEGLERPFLDRPMVLSALPDLRRLRAHFAEHGPLPQPLGLIAPELTGNLAEEAELSALLSEGFFDFLLLPDGVERERLLLYLQATRQKSFTADYIACPSCGRTLFDLQSVTQRIQEKTRHLKGVKIGIMGCIVNGPGEMADADFGYVGSGPGKVDLYFGQERIKRGLGEAQALNELIELIKEKGAWREP